MARARRAHRPAIFASGGIVVAAMLVLSLADFNATREMGPLLALGIVVMMAVGLTLLPALLAAFGRRAFWPAIPRRAGRAARGEPGLDAGSASSCAGIRAARRRLGARCAHARRARQPRRAATTSTSPSSTATRRSPRRARSSSATASTRRAASAPLDLVTVVAGRRSQVSDALRRPRASPTPTRDSQSRGRQADLDRGPAARRPVLDASMDMIPRLREAAREGRPGPDGADRRPHGREPRQPAGAAPRREADRPAGADPDPARADRAAALRRRAAVPDRHRDPVVRVRARRCRRCSSPTSSGSRARTRTWRSSPSSSSSRSASTTTSS